MSEGRNSKLGVVDGLTSSQVYWAKLERYFPQGEHRLRQMRKELGDIQVLETGYDTSDCIAIVFQPGGGTHRIPLPVDTDTVDGQWLKEVSCGRTFPHAAIDIPEKASGKPYVLRANLKS